MKFFLATTQCILKRFCEVGFTRLIYREMRLREVRRLAQDHRAKEKVNRNLNPGFLTPETRLFVVRGTNSILTKDTVSHLQKVATQQAS